MFSVQCGGGGGPGLAEPLEQKRRKMDPETQKLNWSAVKFKKSIGVKLPNFAQINMVSHDKGLIGLMIDKFCCFFFV
jgi:hypothetical protein